MIEDENETIKALAASHRAEQWAQYLDRRAAAVDTMIAAAAPIWQQRLDALRARNRAEIAAAEDRARRREEALELAARVALYGEEAADAAIIKEERAQRRADQRGTARARRLAWRRAYYRRKAEARRIAAMAEMGAKLGRNRNVTGKM